MPTISSSIDRDTALRRRKPEKRIRQLSTRCDDELISVVDLPTTGAVALMADMKVCINNAAARLAPSVETLLDQTILFHCAACVGEMAAGVASSDPAHKGGKDTRAVYAKILGSTPATRLLTSDAQVWANASLIAGTSARTRRSQPHQRKEVLKDARIFLTAAKARLAVLTSDRDHHDLLQQLCPEARCIFD